MVGNVIPYIGGEEEKSEQEPLKIMGTCGYGKRRDHQRRGAGHNMPVPSECLYSTDILRLPLLNSGRSPTKQQLIERLENYRGFPQGTGSANGA